MNLRPALEIQQVLDSIGESLPYALKKVCDDNVHLLSYSTI